MRAQDTRAVAAGGGASPLEEESRYRWFALGVLMIGTFMAVLDATVVNVALARIMASFGAFDGDAKERRFETLRQAQGRLCATQDQRFFLPAMDYFSAEEQASMLDEIWEFDRKLIHQKERRFETLRPAQGRLCATKVSGGAGGLPQIESQVSDSGAENAIASGSDREAPGGPHLSQQRLGWLSHGLFPAAPAPGTAGARDRGR